MQAKYGRRLMVWPYQGTRIVESSILWKPQGYKVAPEFHAERVVDKRGTAALSAGQDHTDSTRNRHICGISAIVFSVSSMHSCDSFMRKSASTVPSRLIEKLVLRENSAIWRW